MTLKYGLLLFSPIKTGLGVKIEKKINAICYSGKKKVKKSQFNLVLKMVLDQRICS